MIQYTHLNIKLDRFGMLTLVSKLGIQNTVFLGTGLTLLNHAVGVLAAIFMPQVTYGSITLLIL